MSILEQNFYNRNTLQVARELLGCQICRKLNGKTIKAKIVETEAYTQDDPACHVFNGKTPRSATLFMQPGIAYIYLIYGMYHCLNFITEPDGTAGAVLIRAVEMKNANGPGKLCRELQIDKTFNQIDVTNCKSGLWVEHGEIIPDNQVVATTRIGIKKAVEYPWRFYIKDNPFVSKL